MEQIDKGKAFPLEVIEEKKILNSNKRNNFNIAELPVSTDRLSVDISQR